MSFAGFRKSPLSVEGDVCLSPQAFRRPSTRGINLFPFAFTLCRGERARKSFFVGLSPDEDDLMPDPRYLEDREVLQKLNFLKPSQVAMIDEALAKLGEYGEVRLVVEKGCLRFLVTQKSYDAYKWQPGSVE